MEKFKTSISKVMREDNILGKYVFGSRLYGTANEKSDTDYIVIQGVYRPIDDVNIHCYTVGNFIRACEQGDISCLEILYSNNNFPFNKEDITLNFESFRRNNSMLTSNSWVKGKKKLIVLGDYDLDIGLKSIFHSLRILDYCIQIGEQKEIYDFTRDSYILKDLYKLSESYNYQDLWDAIDAKYRGEFNRRKSLFKSLFPIDKQTERANEIKNILERYKCYDVELYQELKSLL